MNSRKVVIIIVLLIAGIIGASLLIKPPDEKISDSKNDKNPKNESTEKDEADEIKEAMDKMYELYNISNVIDGSVMKEGFRKGINMGDMLEAPSEGEWGVTFDPEYFRLIKEKGFDFVRIPIRWSSHLDLTKLSSNYYDYVDDECIDAYFLERVDYIINCALGNNLGVVINVQNFEELMTGKAVPVNGDASYKIDPMSVLKNLWGFLAVHYQSMPDSVLFEVHNESLGTLIEGIGIPPHIDIYNIIRNSNPKRGIIFQAGIWENYNGLDQIYIPKGDKNIIISFRFFDPPSFTRQTIEGTKWTNDETERKRIDAALNNIKSFAEATGLPIFLGEFGASGEADTESRVMWTRYVRETAEKYGFTWCYWEFCSGFGIFDSQTMTFNERLASALLEGKKADFNTGKGNAKVTYQTITGHLPLMVYFAYNRKMNILCDGWSNLLLYDSSNNTQIVSVKGAADGGYVLLPVFNIGYTVNSSGDLSNFIVKNNIELTVKNLNDSITDLRISLTQGDLNDEVILYDNDRFDETTTGSYDKKTNITLKIDDYYTDFETITPLYLKVYMETVPERKDNYDRTGSLEFVEMQVY